MSRYPAAKRAAAVVYMMHRYASYCQAAYRCAKYHKQVYAYTRKVWHLKRRIWNYISRRTSSFRQNNAIELKPMQRPEAADEGWVLITVKK
jgi:hypothetical protein